MAESLDDIIAQDAEALEAAPTPEEALNRLHRLVLLAVASEKRMEDLQAQLVAEGTVHRTILERELPQLMQQARLKKTTLEDGTQLTLKEDVYASIAGERQGEAFRWLNENGHGDLIKNELKCNFGKGEEQMAIEAEALLRQHFQGLEPERKQSVHPQTLRAFVREQIQGGKQVPMETFGVGFVTKVTYKLPKQKEKGDSTNGKN